MVSLQASGFTATARALIVTAVVVLSPSLRVLAEQRQQIAELERELEQTDQEVLALEEQLARWSDRAYVETQARSRLMFVYPGDITFLVLDDLPEISDEPDAQVSDEIQVGQGDWREALLASYLVAATTDVSEPEKPADVDPGLLDTPTQEPGS